MFGTHHIIKLVFVAYYTSVTSLVFKSYGYYIYSGKCKGVL